MINLLCSHQLHCFNIMRNAWQCWRAGWHKQKLCWPAGMAQLLLMGLVSCPAQLLQQAMLCGRCWALAPAVGARQLTCVLTEH